jgi:putative transposase
MNGWYSRGYLPHFDGVDMIQHVTFHLADSLPAEAVERMSRELDALPEEQRSRERRQRIQDLLDAGIGSCLLRNHASAGIVQDSLLFGDGNRYRLLAWVIMPNHVHVMIQQIGWPLAKIVQSWKRHTSREIHRLLGVPSCTRPDKGAEHTPAIPGLWQREYWDRYIRDERHFLAAKSYIEQNPVRAGLVADSTDWRWGHMGWAKKMSETAEP